MLVFQFVEHRPLRLLAAADLLDTRNGPTVGACNRRRILRWFPGRHRMAERAHTPPAIKSLYPVLTIPPANKRFAKLRSSYIGYIVLPYVVIDATQRCGMDAALTPVFDASRFQRMLTSWYPHARTIFQSNNVLDCSNAIAFQFTPTHRLP